MTEPLDLWRFMLWGYPLTVALETVVLLAALAPRHPLRRKLLAGFWLTACTYPVVVVVLPILMAGSSRAAYLTVAETFAPAAETLLFWAAFPADAEGRSTRVRDAAAIVAANLASFLPVELARINGWITW